MKQVKQHLMSLISWNPEVMKSSIVAQHVEQWRSNSLHGQWPCLFQDKNSKSFGWLRTAHLKPVKEALLTAAQDQAICTNWLVCHILGTATSDLCRKCGVFPENVEHIVAGCPVMAQTVYLNCHNAITSAVQWESLWCLWF